MPVPDRIQRGAVRSALRLYAAAAALAVAATACGGDDDDKGPTAPGNEVQLTSGVSISGLSGGEGSERYYRITVPTGAARIQVTTAGGSGDLDLGVRRATRPTFDDADCFSGGDTNSETCTIEAPQAGTWYIGLFAFEAYSGVTLTGTISAGTRR